MGALLAALFVCGSAHAVELGGGLIAVGGGNFLSKASNPLGGGVNQPGAPAFSGLTIGGGLMLDARFLDGRLGLETDVLVSNDRGTGKIVSERTQSANGGIDIQVTVGQPAWHVPVLAKLAIPLGTVSPTFVLGPEIVLPMSAKAASSPAQSYLLVRETSDVYVMITAGAGAEIRAALPKLDLRFPIGLRGSLAPAVSNDLADRARATVTASQLVVTYRSEWKYAVNVTAGAALYF